ncbi:MAG: FKBP-type peptidyl-prolyl cis-trans isomerase [Bacteroidetes bacterium]|nr:FKBP-type peptidyl-prolyl cis-trans isomerase [Bacteroidota bacterium]
MKKNFYIAFVAAFCLAFFSCENKSNKKTIVVNYNKLKEDIIQTNKPAVVMEQDEINAYIKSHQYTMQSTGTGLRYMFLNENAKELKIEEGDRIRVNYTVSLLDGTPCYTSKKNGAKQFVVGSDRVESGIHEGVQLMHLHDKALFILPAHLAFGLLGDRDKIPPKAAVVYTVEVLTVEKNKNEKRDVSLQKNK